MDERSDALRVLGVGKAFEEAVGGLQRGECHLSFADERSEAFAMALAGFAEEHSFDGAAGTKGFLDEADAFNANGARFCWQAPAKRHAEFLEPTIVAAGEKSWCGRGRSGACGFAWNGH